MNGSVSPDATPSRRSDQHSALPRPPAHVRFVSARTHEYRYSKILLCVVFVTGTEKSPKEVCAWLKEVVAGLGKK